MKLIITILLILNLSLSTVVSVSNMSRMRSLSNSLKRRSRTRQEFKTWYANLGWGFLTGLTGGLNQDIKDCFTKVILKQELKQKTPEKQVSWEKSSAVGRVAIVFDGLNTAKDLVCAPFRIASIWQTSPKDGWNTLEKVGNSVEKAGSALASLVTFANKIPDIAKKEDGSDDENLKKALKKDELKEIAKKDKSLKNKIKETAQKLKNVITEKLTSVGSEIKSKVAEFAQVLRRFYEDSDLKALIDTITIIVNHPCFQAITKIIGFVVRIVTIISAITAKVAAHSSSLGVTVPLEVAWLVVKIVNSVCNHFGFLNGFVQTLAKAMDNIKIPEKKMLGYHYFGELIGMSTKEISDITFEVFGI